jgi:hypothetical protein
MAVPIEPFKKYSEHRHRRDGFLGCVFAPCRPYSSATLTHWPKSNQFHSHNERFYLGTWMRCTSGNSQLVKP